MSLHAAPLSPEPAPHAAPRPQSLLRPAKITVSLSQLPGVAVQAVAAPGIQALHFQSFCESTLVGVDAASQAEESAVSEQSTAAVAALPSTSDAAAESAQVSVPGAAPNPTHLPSDEMSCACLSPPLPLAIRERLGSCSSPKHHALWGTPPSLPLVLPHPSASGTEEREELPVARVGAVAVSVRLLLCRCLALLAAGWDFAHVREWIAAVLAATGQTLAAPVHARLIALLNTQSAPASAPAPAPAPAPVPSAGGPSNDTMQQPRQEHDWERGLGSGLEPGPGVAEQEQEPVPTFEVHVLPPSPSPAPASAPPPAPAARPRGKDRDNLDDDDDDQEQQQQQHGHEPDDAHAHAHAHAQAHNTATATTPDDESASSSARDSFSALVAAPCGHLSVRGTLSRQHSGASDDSAMPVSPGSGHHVMITSQASSTGGRPSQGSIVEDQGESGQHGKSEQRDERERERGAAPTSPPPAPAPAPAPAPVIISGPESASNPAPNIPLATATFVPKESSYPPLHLRVTLPGDRFGRINTALLFSTPVDPAEAAAITAAAAALGGSGGAAANDLAPQATGIDGSSSGVSDGTGSHVYAFPTLAAMSAVAPTPLPAVPPSAFARPQQQRFAFTGPLGRALAFFDDPHVAARFSSHAHENPRFPGRRTLLVCVVALGRMHELGLRQCNQTLIRAPAGSDSVVGWTPDGSGHMYAVFESARVLSVAAVTVTLPPPSATTATTTPPAKFLIPASLRVFFTALLSRAATAEQTAQLRLLMSGLLQRHLGPADFVAAVEQCLRAPAPADLVTSLHMHLEHVKQREAV